MFEVERIQKYYKALEHETSLMGVPEGVVQDPAAFAELLKFLAIRAEIDGLKESGHSIGMRSGPVDDAWHRWILHTADYLGAVQDAVGFILHHKPCRKDINPNEWIERLIRFRYWYRLAFGPVPEDLWGTWAAVEAEYLVRRGA